MSASREDDNDDSSTVADSMDSESFLRVVEFGGLQYVATSYLPLFVQSLEEPQIALTHFFDINRLFVDQAYEVDDSHKKKSLRMLLGKSGASSKAKTASRKARPGDELGTPASSSSSSKTGGKVSKQDAKLVQLINNEVDRVCKHVNDNQGVFLSVVARIARVHSESVLAAICDFSPHLMVDHTVSQHPRLRQLSMFDIRLLIRTGRTELESYLLRRTAAEALGYDNAAHRLSRISQYAGTFVSERAGANLSGALPIGWNLHPRTHTELSEREQHEQRERIMGEFAFMLIGMFAFFNLHSYKQQLINGLIRSFV
jgi:hypothetical protein